MYSKETIESKLLQKEIEKYEFRYRMEIERHKLEKRKLWVVTISSGLISLAIALATIGSNLWIKKNEVNLKLDELQFNHYKDLETKFFSEPKEEDKLSIACALTAISRKIPDFIDPVTNSKFAKLCSETSKVYENSVEKRTILSKIDINDSTKYGAIFRLLDSIEKKSLTYPYNGDKKKLDAEKVNLIRHLPTIYTALNNANKRVDSSEISIQNTLNRLDTRQLHEVKYSKSFWLRETYCLPFSNITIICLAINKEKGVEVQICSGMVVDSKDCDKPIKQKELITTEKPLDFDYSTSKYKIQLEKIDFAGADPFKLAAFIHITESK